VIASGPSGNWWSVAKPDRETLFKLALGLVLAGPVLALGAVHPPVLAASLVPAAALFVLLALGGRRLPAPRFDLPAVLLLALAGFTALQLVPLPAGLVEIVSPAAHEVRSRALMPLGLAGPACMPLTLDVPLTVLELGKLLLYLAVYLAAAAWSRRHGGQLVHILVLVAGAAAAFVMLGHKVLLLDRAYGFYEPLHAGFGGERATVPLLNPNHMAGLLGLAAAIGIGQALSSAERGQRLLLIGLASLIGGGLLLTVSRGGIAAFLVGQLVFIALRLIDRARTRHESPAAGHVAWLPLGLALSLGLGLFVAQDAILGDFAGGDFRKVEMLGEALPLIGSFPITGVGRGAFWVAFPLASDWAARVTFTHAENAVVQALSDWGILVGAAALLGFALPVGRRLLAVPARARHAAALAALTAFGIHNLVDFNVEVPGVAVIAAAILGSLAGGSRAPGGAAAASDRRRVPVWLTLALGAAALALAALAWLYGGRFHVDQEERRLRAALAARDAAAFEPEAVREILVRHPASWYVPFVVGAERSFRRGQNPLPWLSRAIELNPASAAAHFHVGRVMADRGLLDQGLLELRIAARNNRSLVPAAARLLVGAGHDFERLSAWAREPEDQVPLYGALAAEFARRGRSGEAEAADRAVLEIDPRNVRSLARHARRLSARGEGEAALEFSHRLGRVDGHAVPGAILEAEIRAAAGDRPAAMAVLERALERDPRHPELLRTAARACQAADRPGRALELAERLRALATDARSRAAATVLSGELEQAQGKVQAALASYQRAAALVPEDTRLLLRIADLSREHGDAARELSALRRLVRLQPGNEQWQGRLAALEARVGAEARGRR
jgi:tetratricopeptide (TPR) repeat protein